MESGGWRMGKFKEMEIGVGGRFILWKEGMSMTGVHVRDRDKERGSPKDGDIIYVNPECPDDRILVSKEELVEKMDLTRRIQVCTQEK
jgi:hypothetical protein